MNNHGHVILGQLHVACFSKEASVPYLVMICPFITPTKAAQLSMTCRGTSSAEAHVFNPHILASSLCFWRVRKKR